MEEGCCIQTRGRIVRAAAACLLLFCLNVAAQDAGPVVPGRDHAEPQGAPAGETAPASKVPPAFPGAPEPHRPTTGQKLWGGASPNWEAEALMYRMRNSEDPEARARALEMLPLDAVKESDFDRLFTAAASPETPVVRAAWTVLDRCTEKDLFAYVIRTLAWGAADRVRTLDASLPRLGPRLESLMTATLETEIEAPRHRRAAAYCLGRTGSVGAAPVLAKYAQSEQGDLAQTCAVALSMLRAPDVLRDWEAMLTHSDTAVRTVAVRALADLDTAPARRALFETAAGKREAGRQAEQEAARMIAQWADADALPALIQIMRENTALNGLTARLLHDKTGQSFGTSPEPWEAWLQQGGQKRGNAEVTQQQDQSAQQ